MIPITHLLAYFKELIFENNVRMCTPAKLISSANFSNLVRCVFLPTSYRARVTICCMHVDI